VSDDPDENVYTRRNHRVAQWQGKAKLPAAYKRAPKQEREKKEKLKGARLIPASGARFRKGDAEVPNLARIECKATQAMSFSVTRLMMRKIEDAGILNNQIPYIEIEFVNERGAVQESACVLSRHALTTLLNRLSDAENLTPTDRRSIERFERHSRRFSPKSR